MGTEQSKPRTSTYRSSVSFEILNGSIAFSNGDKYVGDFKDGQLTGNGTYYYINNDVYKGDWRCNKKQGFGIQIYAKEAKKYVGHWQDNLPYGEGTLYYSDGSYYVGSFLEGEKHGEGVLYDTEGDGYEEEWANGELIRRSPLSPFKQRQTSSHTSSTANKRGSKEELNENNSDNQDESEAKSAPKSEGNENKSESDEDFSDSRKKQNRNKDKDYDDKRLHSNILFKSQNEYDSSDVKTYDVGLETLNIIEHMDMLNSVAGVLLNKDVQEWTFKDVGDWLRHLGLNDYVEAFKKNHINGQVLFEITEADLKDEFGMTSVGHRKNFIKAVENLKRIFCDENEKNSEYVRHKIQKFYERNRPSMGGRSLFAGLRPREGRFYSHRFNSRNTYNSQHEVIDEDDELDLKNEPTPSPQMVQRKKTFEGKDEFSRLTEQISKIASPKPKKPAWDAVDDSNIKSLEDVEEARQNENPFRGNPSKRTLSKISSESQKSSPAKEEQNMLKQDHHDIAEEFKSSHSKKNDKMSSISHEGSSSDSSTDSEPSDDEKLAKANPEKVREDAIPAEVGFLKIGKAASKNDKKMTKKNTAGSLHNFKSAELPVIQRSMSNKAILGKKPRRKHPQSKENLNEKIKDEILRIFKDSGLNENFIIDYNELTFDKKIGEGGYGRVFLGKFSGIDVAIKEYGKTKLDVRRAEDFVKEVEVISNLRHPNIVLCMGACIHNGKYLMITEYLEEGSLFDHLHKKHTKIQDETMINIIEDIALGMCYLHGRKVFHCDLKSSNILIDSSWSVKLCDFGLSRVKYKSDRKRFQKQRVGTPHWMAPEILRGEKYDESADVYSFGMILWELVMGEIPYHNTPISDIIATVGYEGKQINLPIKGNALILSIMKSCLSLNKYERPTFKQIVDQLQQKTKGALNANKKNNLFSIFGS